MFLKTQLSYPTEYAHFATRYAETRCSVCHVYTSCDLTLSVRKRKTSNDKKNHRRQINSGRKEKKEGWCEAVC